MIFFLVSNEMVLSEGFVVEDDDSSFDMIINGVRKKIEDLNLCN